MVTNLPPRDTKKGPKLYDIATPLLHAEVCAAATNSGIAILRAAFKPTLAVCGLPHLAAFESDGGGQSDDLLALDGGGGGDDAAPDGVRKECAVSVVMVVGGKLIGSTFTSPDPELMEGGTSDAERAALGRGIPAKLQAPGHAPPLEVAVSQRCAPCRHTCATHSRHSPAMASQWPWRRQRWCGIAFHRREIHCAVPWPCMQACKMPDWVCWSLIWVQTGGACAGSSLRTWARAGCPRRYR